VSSEPVFTSLSLTPNTITISVNQRLPLSAQAVDQRNQPISGVSISYLSSAPTVASVDASGQVTGLALGQATITATGAKGAISKTATSTVTVSGTPPTAVTVAASPTSPPDTFAPSRADIAVGGTVTWTFGAVDHNVVFATAAGAPANIGTTRNTQVSRTFGTAGTFTYTCTLHANMNGTVVVR
jgi:plastocyanin